MPKNSKKMSLATMPCTALTGGLDGFISGSYDLPLLSAEEEYALAVRYRKHNDIEAAHKLVIHNMRFVIQVARSYGGYGLPLADLVHEGSIGLMKAVKKFDPEVGVRMVSFAVYWIRAEIHEFILRNWRMVKVATTKAQRKLFFNLRSMKKHLTTLNPEEVQAVSDHLGVKPQEVREMETRMSGKDISFDPLIEDSSEGMESYTTPAAYLEDHSADPAQQAEESDWREHCQKKFQTALAKVDQRSLEILQARYLGSKKATLQELAKRYNVSAERIRQIESQAIKQLRELTAESA